MSWRDRLLPASFRGEPFGVEAHDAASGRRVVPHEYPGRDRPWTEDLGARARAWSVRGFVVGPDYDRARDALVRACNAPGPGTLVHPYLGTIEVLCEECVQSERSDTAGVARFQLRFVDAGENVEPRAAPDTLAAVESAATAARAASRGAFMSGWPG